MRNFIIPQFADTFKKGRIAILKHFCFEKMSTVAHRVQQAGQIAMVAKCKHR